LYKIYLNKETIRENLEEETYLLGISLRSLGNFEKNTSITEVTAFSESNLKNMMEDKQVTLTKKVLGLGKENVKKLSDYGIAEADFTKLEGLIAQFTDIQTIPRSKLVDRKAAKELLTSQMELMRRREPEFYSAYQSARKIVDTGIRHEKKVTKTAEDENQNEATK
jgi:hypothetical protein